MKMHHLLPLGVFIGLATLLAAGLKLNPGEVPSPLIDKPAPPFSLPELRDPARAVTHEDLRGKVTLLNVWASWCVACREEHPLLMHLAEAQRVTIYGLDYKDRRDDALRWLQHMGDPYVATAVDADGRVGIDYGVYGVPETFLIDRQGRIRYKHIGPLTEAAVRKTLLPMIARLQDEST